MPIVLCFGEDAVFALTLGVNSNPMLRQTAEHVFALADVDSLIVDADFINARVFITISPTIAFQPFVCVFFISGSFVIFHQNFLPSFLSSLVFYKYYNKIFV